MSSPRPLPHAVPRYVEIELALRAEVAELPPGHPLPSDAELCERFGVSRMTARSGVQRLADAGLVYRVPGQGTFVAEPPIQRHAGSLVSFSEDMRSRGLEPSSTALVTDSRPATAEEQRALTLAPGASVIVLERLRLADGQPMATERSVLPATLAAVADADLERGSLHQALEQLGVSPARASGTVEPQAATAADSRLLGIEAGAPMLVERRTVFDRDDRPIELTESRYSPSRYVFAVELVRALSS